MRWLQFKSIYLHLQHLRTVNSIKRRLLTTLENRTGELFTLGTHSPSYLPSTTSNNCPVVTLNTWCIHSRDFHALSLGKQFSQCQLRGCTSFHSGVYNNSNKKIDRSQVPTLNEEDLEESFVRGSGPGGQSVNKTASACMLRHTPTGKE